VSASPEGRRTAPAVTSHLRDYRLADFDALYEIDSLCFDAAIAYSRRELREYLRLPGAECLVAEAAPKSGTASAAEILGFIVTARRRQDGYIVTIDVLPNHRRHAVGTSLLAEAEKRLATQGATEVSIETATENASAIAFWQKHGYRTRGVITGYYPGGRDAFSMTKLLDPPAQNRKARS
jgi:ribosomal protein S18 acetylase RimI-like enzyme